MLRNFLFGYLRKFILHYCYQICGQRSYIQCQMRLSVDCSFLLNILLKLNANLFGLFKVCFSLLQYPLEEHIHLHGCKYNFAFQCAFSKTNICSVPHDWDNILSDLAVQLS